LRGGFTDLPFLDINKQEYGLPLMPFISGHEGRHRSRALAASGQPTSLVRLMPRAELREPFPRRTQEEYIEALRRELEMTDNMVIPQAGDNLPPRPAILLPEPYAEGGPAKKTHISSNPDTMRMELDERRLGIGGFLGKTVKGAQKAKTATQEAAPLPIKASQPSRPPIDLERLKSGGIEVPQAGFSKEEKATLRPLYNQGLIRVEEREGKQILVPGQGAWYEFATPQQKSLLDSLQRSQGGVKDLSLMPPTESVLNSAQASFYDFEIAPGVRNVPIKNLEPFLPGYESPNELRRIESLAGQIRESKEIEPLFIGVDPTGIPYIMEGQHRIRALKSLGYDEVPARIVIDMDDVGKAEGGAISADDLTIEERPL
jgi:hypothetical protein